MMGNGNKYGFWDSTTAQEYGEARASVSGSPLHAAGSYGTSHLGGTLDSFTST